MESLAIDLAQKHPAIQFHVSRHAIGSPTEYQGLAPQHRGGLCWQWSARVRFCGTLDRTLPSRLAATRYGGSILGRAVGELRGDSVGLGGDERRLAAPRRAHFRRTRAWDTEVDIGFRESCGAGHSSVFL